MKRLSILSSVLPSWLTAREKSKGELAAKLTNIWRCIRENDFIVISTENGPALRARPKKSTTILLFRQLTAIMRMIVSICRNEIDDKLERDKVMKSAKISGESRVLHLYFLSTTNI